MKIYDVDPDEAIDNIINNPLKRFLTSLFWLAIFIMLIFGFIDIVKIIMKSIHTIYISL